MDESFASVVNAFTEEHNMKRADIDYFRDVMRGIHEDREVLESLITSRLDRGYDEIDPVEKGILLLGCYELRSRLDVPYRVVINEGVELAKSFGATDSFKYVNSILDSLARELRTAE